MHKQFYFLSPVEVVKVTPNNLQEVAEWCGGKVAQAESRKVAGRMDSYVWVPTPKGTAVSWAFPGMYVTKRLVITLKGELKATWAVFRRDYFEKNYFDTPLDAVNNTWEKEDRSSKKPSVVINQVITTSSMKESVEKLKVEMGKIAKAAGIDLEKLDEGEHKEAPEETLMRAVPVEEPIHTHAEDQVECIICSGDIEAVVDSGVVSVPLKYNE